jgi:uroporphyrinogen III methyltransferase/synthase
VKRTAVFLIGTGPGDPDLITARGLRCLKEADVVIHDHRVSRRLLEHARAGAEILDVGSSSANALAQEAISYLVADKAREGKIVAHLKWGDPFVFDRAGEEALYLHEQGIGFEVVPGIPAAIGVPTYAGVPLTYPGAGHTVALVQGFDDESRTIADIDWASLARLEGTIVVSASAQQMPRVVEAMLGHRRAADEQAIVVVNGTLTNQESICGSLGELPDLMRQHARRGPAVLVAGRVVGFRDHLRWFDSRPLFGRRVLVTRPREQAAELVEGLTALGAEAIEAPMIRIVPPEDPSALLRAAAQPAAFDWIVFTSANAVDAFMRALLDGERDVRALKGPRLCAIGTSTAARLRRYGIKVDLVPPEFHAGAVVPEMARTGSLARVRVLLPRADIGRELIGDQLRAAGATVTEVVAYRTVDEDAQRPDAPDVYAMLLEGRIDVATFTSASAVRSFARIFGADQAADLLKTTVVATIGPTTAEAVAHLGVEVTVQPATYTVPGLIEAIAAHYAAARA